LTLRPFARRLDRMTRLMAHAFIARAAKRTGAASCTPVAMAHAAAVTMRKQGVITSVARSPGQGRS